jgi:tetratricopeptide (TPR) repeat protein
MIGWCRAQLHDYADAVACCEEALTVFRATGDHAGYANTADSLGFACHRLGLTGQAITAYRDAIDRWRTVGDRYGLAQSLIHLGDVHADVGSIGDAVDAWQDGLAILDDLGHPDAADVRRKVDAHRDGATAGTTRQPPRPQP